MKNLNKYFIISSLFLTLLGGLALGSFFAHPQASTAGELSLDEQEATIRAIAKAQPAVVNVMVYDYETKVYLDLKNGDQQSKIDKVLVGQGTGFLISSNGWILTNKHVVEAAQTDKAEYTVVLSDKRKYQAALAGKDPFNDLAILRILGADFPYLQLASTKDLSVGTTALAIGNALGKYQNSVTKGIISGLSRSVVASDKNGQTVNLENVIQTDAEINHGNSGGPLINLQGQVIGVNVAIDETGSSIGFAIPSDDARVVIDSIIKYGRIIRPWLGVRYIMITPEIAVERKLAVDSGALLIVGQNKEPAVVAGSPAAVAGLQENDIILSVNDTVLDSNHTLLAVTQSYKPGDTLNLKVRRGDRVIDLKIVLQEFKL